MPRKPQQKTPDSAPQNRQPTEIPDGLPLTITWLRVGQRTSTHLKRLREFGLPPDTAVFRIVQGEREKATVFGNIDQLGDTERGDLTTLVRDVIEGRPPADFSPTQPVLTSPSRVFIRTRCRLRRIEKKEWKGRLTVEELDAKMTVFGAEGMVITDEAARVLAHLLWEAAEKELVEEERK